MAQRKMLRSGGLDEHRVFTVEAASLPSGEWEAWFTCARITALAGVGAISETLQVGANLEELQSWADGLTADDLGQLAKATCP